MLDKLDYMRNRWGSFKHTTLTSVITNNLNSHSRVISWVGTLRKTCLKWVYAWSELPVRLINIFNMDTCMLVAVHFFISHSWRLFGLVALSPLIRVTRVCSTKLCHFNVNEEEFAVCVGLKCCSPTSSPTIISIQLEFDISVLLGHWTKCITELQSHSKQSLITPIAAQYCDKSFPIQVPGILIINPPLHPYMYLPLQDLLDKITANMPKHNFGHF